MRYFSILLFAFSCAPDPSESLLSQQDEMMDLAITVIFAADKDVQYVLYKDQTFKERLQNTFYADTLSAKNDTVYFPLDEPSKLVYGYVPLELDRQTLLIAAGDTIHIAMKDSQTEFYKFHQGKKEDIRWTESNILPDNTLFKEKEALRVVFVREKQAGELVFLEPNTDRRDRWHEHVVAYISTIERYYGELIDSLRVAGGDENAIFMDILKRRQFLELSSLSDVVNDSALTERLYSREYINADYLNNRYLNLAMSIYFRKRYAYSKDIILTEAYDEGFSKYPEEMRRFFKVQALQSMIIKKYNRDVILDYVSRYKDEFGSILPLAPMLTEIEYGTVADHDLILQDRLGKVVKWGDLRKQWEGKIIYVDFWASWCGPCLRAIPFSKELQKQLLNQEVVFVYLALNDKEEAWGDMSKKYQIEENNYLIMNSRSSKFIAQTNLDAIPRYMIYDRNGQLIHQDAPGPDQKEALEIISSYLKGH